MDKFTYFWCLIIVAMSFFFIGFYKNFVLKIGYILWVNSKDSEGQGPGWLENLRSLWPGKQTIVDEAILQRRIKQRSDFLWTRHALIFFGFTVIFAFDLFYTFAGHYAHHYFHIDYFMSGPGKGILKTGMEFSGAVLLLGLTMGIIHRWVNAGTEKRYVDINLLILLWLVTVTGFATEAFRLAAQPDDPLSAYSFIGAPIAKQLISLPYEWEPLTTWMWCIHATITAAFFAYIPYSKFVHMLAAPLGRSIARDGAYGAHKRQTISEGLL